MELEATCEDLCNVDELDRCAVLLCETLHVHEARRVRTGDELSTCSTVACNLVTTHTCRYIWLLNSEHTAETAALVNALWLYNFDALYELEEILYLVEAWHATLRR